MPGLYLPLEDLTQCHVGVWGRTRYGKTFVLANLVSQVSQREPGRTFVFYDSQGELAGLLANLLPPEKLLRIEIKDYWKNPLQDLYDHGLDKAIGLLKRALMEAAYVGDATVNLSEQLIRQRCTAEKLAALGPPTLADMVSQARHLESRGTSYSRKVVEYQGSLLNCLGNLSLNLGSIYNRPIAKGFSFRDFEGLVAVIDLSAIKDPIALKFFVVKELLELSLYAETAHPPLTVVLDELHRYAPLEKRWGQFSAPILVDAVKTLLKQGINFWYAEQNPGTRVDPAIFANTGTHFAFRMPSMKDRWPVLYAINVSDREQEQAAGTLEKRHCLVYSDWLGSAVLIRTPELQVRDLGQEAARRSAPVIKAFHERFLAESPRGDDKMARERQDTAPSPLSAQELIRKGMARHRIDFPLSGITDTYAEVGLSPEVGKRHLKEMLELGWLEGPERMPGPGKGPKAKDCYVVTEKGCLALGLDWAKARLPGKGSLKSRLAARLIGLHLERKGVVVRYEYALSSPVATKAADVAGLEADGSVTAYEFESTNSHLLENIRRNALAGFTRTVVVCPNAAALSRARRAAGREIEPELRDRVSFGQLKEFAS